jgi:hypothetical protein
VWHHAITCFPTFGSSPASHSCYVELAQALDKLALTLSPSLSSRDPDAQFNGCTASELPVRIPRDSALTSRPQIAAITAAVRYSSGLCAELSINFQLPLLSHFLPSPAQGCCSYQAVPLLTDVVFSPS